MSKKKRNWLEEGPPAWFWPCSVTGLAMAERVLALFDIGRAFDLVSTPGAAWLPNLVGVVLARYISNKWVSQKALDQGQDETKR